MKFIKAIYENTIQYKYKIFSSVFKFNNEDLIKKNG